MGTSRRRTGEGFIETRNEPQRDRVSFVFNIVLKFDKTMTNPGLDLFKKQMRKGILEFQYSFISVGADDEVFQVRSCMFSILAQK